MSMFDAFVRKIKPKYGVDLKVSDTGNTGTRSDFFLSRLTDFRKHVAEFQSVALKENNLMQRRVANRRRTN